MEPALPRFVEPMLAQPGAPFDSNEHLFEVKWDGTRALAFVEGGTYRLRNRNQKDLVPVYPELAFLAGLPGGVVLDGEVVIQVDGKPDFNGMLRREQARGELRIRSLMQTLPAVYMVFDVLYRGHAPVLDEPLSTRRAILTEVAATLDEERFQVSEGVVGGGLALFETIRSQELEGMVAKRLNSRYLPGQRTEAWTKIKEAREVLCAILGYLVDDDGSVRSLVIGADIDGTGLRCVGRVGSGLTEVVRARLADELGRRHRAHPVVACDTGGIWVEPELVCQVRYLERTPSGNLRAPVFVALLT